MKEEPGRNHREFERYTRTALARFVERFALPAAAFTLSTHQAHEILRLLDAEARLHLACRATKALEGEYARTRQQLSGRVSAKRRRALNKKLITINSRALKALERARAIADELRELAREQGRPQRTARTGRRADG